MGYHLRYYFVENNDDNGGISITFVQLRIPQCGARLGPLGARRQKSDVDDVGSILDF